MSVSIKTSRKIGFFTAISILIGSVIGIGIFFKNDSVFRANSHNGYSVLIAWILSAVISTATAFSFAEASTSVNSNTGLGGWSEKLCGKKIGYFTKFNFGIFYFGILLISFAVFLSESIFNIFLSNKDKTNGTPWMIYIFLVAIVIMTLLVVLNLLATKVSQISQIVLSSLKFIPILMVVIIGLIFFSKYDKNLFIPDNILNSPSKPTSTNINFTHILTSLPAILFAFDSFTCVGSIASEAKSERTVPLAIVVGMILVSGIYLLITIVQILTGGGSIEKVFENMLGKESIAFNVINIITNVFMFLSVLGVANSFTITCLRTCDGIVNEKLVVGHNLFIKWGKNKPLFAGAFLFGIVGIFWYIIAFVCSAILGHDAFVDGMSNYPTLFFFAIYGIVVLFTLINRFTKKVKVKKQNSYIFYPMAMISILGIGLIFGYQFFYENIVKLFTEKNSPISWGVLFGPTKAMEVWEGAIVFFVMLAFFMIVPIINYFLNKKSTSNSALNMQATNEIMNEKIESNELIDSNEMKNIILNL